jgi:hypothetical protein
MRVLAFALALVGAAVSAVVIATTLPSDGPFVPTWVTWPLFVGCLLVHVQTVRTARDDLKRRLLETPRPILVTAGLLAACVFTLTMHALLTTRGNPERHGTGYYLRDHSELTQVSRAEYGYAERLVERDFVGIALIFYLAGILVHFPIPRGRVVAARG